ncbi:uncharacterized protein DDB_G0271670-like [Coregonus clupeaformis]|uniref:uncharacterized protein DDB_G0271670-like n=1 Tax=Coregonus clupeaformis TaxID=59861 RepID=UPI001E1C51AD|nr:uncharacterized protein DDB_G0271670-like [Coregonus clupeaformis]
MGNAHGSIPAGNRAHNHAHNRARRTARNPFIVGCPQQFLLLVLLQRTQQENNTTEVRPVVCSSFRGGADSSSLPGKVARSDGNKVASQSAIKPRSHNPFIGTHTKGVANDRVKNTSVDNSYKPPGSHSAPKGSYRTWSWINKRRLKGSEDVDKVTSETLEPVREPNEEGYVPNVTREDDSGDDSDTSSGSGSTSSSSSGSSSSSSDSSRVTGVIPEAYTEPCVSAKPETRCVENAAESSETETVSSVTNFPSTAATECAMSTDVPGSTADPESVSAATHAPYTNAEVAYTEAESDPVAKDKQVDSVETNAPSAAATECAMSTDVPGSTADPESVSAVIGIMTSSMCDTSEGFVAAPVTNPYQEAFIRNTNNNRCPHPHSSSLHRRATTSHRSKFIRNGNNTKCPRHPSSSLYHRLSPSQSS